VQSAASFDVGDSDMSPQPATSLLVVNNNLVIADIDILSRADLSLREQLARLYTALDVG